MYMYIDKGSNKLIIGMPTLDNWATVMDIKDPVKLKWIKKTDDEIIQIMKDCVLCSISQEERSTKRRRLTFKNALPTQE